MKKIAFLLILSAVCCCAMAQKRSNNNPDAIVGTYKVDHGDQHSKVRIYKDNDGNYTAQCIWLRDSLDPKTGKIYTDIRNPNKSLRTVPCNKIIIFKGLKYNAKKKRWEDAKIYDPTRGIRANCTAEFTDKGTLKIRGSVMGIGESVIWIPLN